MTANIGYILGEKGEDVFPAYYVLDNLIHAGHKRKIFLGNHTNRFCRFCRRGTSSTTFRQDAHLIPEFMGNNILLSYFECDECNARFSKYESAFANYFNINHSFARLKGKKKIPEYYSKNEKFRVAPGAEDIKMYAGIGNKSVTINEQAQLMTIQTIRPSYIPCYVLKCLVKIGLCAIKESDLHYFEMTRKWLIGECDESVLVARPYSIIYYNIGGGLRAKFPSVSLFSKRQNKPVPLSAVIIAYDHFKFQFFLPFDTRDLGLLTSPNVLLPIQGHLVREKEDGKGLGFYWKDLSGTEKVIGEEHTFSIGIIGGQSMK